MHISARAAKLNADGFRGWRARGNTWPFFTRQLCSDGNSRCHRIAVHPGARRGGSASRWQPATSQRCV